ncbi:uncharacterized protein LOC117167232 [Belonocnema kinseyi]|uniref:uncharacterized protein LOC117167232 n=1 Tax=Belonocnema kinseyi TaxID=2817044 RepID=UPI00143DCC7F|nr:uncharacterized protein LOC117167232 [Belonocnema kinseyi]XP_033207902.1 uncharacterized protein LOC117167232 [Belonocnema kinseyi]XP_033207903.1 uncharacterized protein LOC117167232 [Belonocnema kinseyi]
MEKLPRHCRENGFFFKHLDYVNLDMKSDGIRTGMKFVKVPDFYNIDDREYFATEIKIEGLKVSAAAVATENVLNIKMQETEGRKNVRNLNFLIPEEADPRKASVEIFGGNTIFVMAPLRKLTRERFDVNRPE